MTTYKNLYDTIEQVTKHTIDQLDLFKIIERDIFFAKPNNLKNVVNEQYIEILNIIEQYKKIENNIKIEYLFNDLTKSSPVNFKQSMKLPRHRWFPYKEGFSPLFVKSFLKKYTKNENINILDPFSGVGTTAIESSILGFTSTGFDVNPLSNFIAKTKSINLNADEIKKFENCINIFKYSNLEDMANKPQNSTVVSYFSEENLALLMRLKNFYLNIENQKFRDLFKLAFLRIAEPLSTHRKDGNGVKKKKINSQILSFINLSEFKKYVINILTIYLNDIKETISEIKTNFILDSCLNENLYKATDFNCVLTSPPYANCFDYSKVYLSELWLGDFFIDKTSQKNFRKHSIRSHVHASWEDRFENNSIELIEDKIFNYLKNKNLWSNKIPEMIKGYFKDIGRLLEILSIYLKHDAVIGFVVGNSVYEGLPIATDLLISKIAEKYNFRTEKIEVYRKLNSSSQQQIKLKHKEYLRESLIVLRKN